MIREPRNKNLDLTFQKSTHTNALRALSALTRREKAGRPARVRYDANGHAVNPLRREKSSLRRAHPALASGRAYVRFRKALARSLKQEEGSWTP
jgi:hypothetical protein